MKIKRVGVDLAKNVFQLHGADRRGKTVWKRRLSRGKWLKVLNDTVEPGTEIGMESCTGAHHWTRQLMQQGYPVKIIPPQFVKPFIKSNNNDANDAAAICEARGRPNMHNDRWTWAKRAFILPLLANSVRELFSGGEGSRD